MFVCGTRRETLERLSMTYVYGKRQTVGSCVSQKHENLPFSTCLTLLRSYSIHLGNRQERGLNKPSFYVFWQKENFILPFAVNFMLSIHVTRVAPHSPMSAPLTPVMQTTCPFSGLHSPLHRGFRILLKYLVLKANTRAQRRITTR